jgi:hypothetical protein
MICLDDLQLRTLLVPKLQIRQVRFQNAAQLVVNWQKGLDPQLRHPIHIHHPSSSFIKSHNKQSHPPIHPSIHPGHIKPHPPSIHPNNPIHHPKNPLRQVTRLCLDFTAEADEGVFAQLGLVRLHPDDSETSTVSLLPTPAATTEAPLAPGEQRRCGRLTAARHGSGAGWLVRGWGWLGVGVRVGKWGLKVGKN